MSDQKPAPQATLTIAFDTPLSFGSHTATEVTLREPTAAEYDAASGKPGFGLARQLMVTVGGLPGPMAGMVPISKVVQADAFFAQFLNPAPPKPVVPEPPQPGDAAVYDAMQLREPTLAELEAAGVGRIGTARLVHFTSGIPLDVAMRMPLSRIMACDAFFAGFARPAQTTGNS